MSRLSGSISAWPGRVWQRLLSTPYQLARQWRGGWKRLVVARWRYKRLLRKQTNYKLRHLFFMLQCLLFSSLLYGAAVVALFNTAASHTDSAMPITLSSSNNVNVPALHHGIKFGLYWDTPDPTTEEKALGKSFNMTAWFVHWNTSLASNKLDYSCSHGYVPAITWESWDGEGTNWQTAYPLSDIVAGKYDTYLRTNLEAVRRICKQQTVIIRWDHEMDAPPGMVLWYPWQGNPQLYIAAWQHIVTMSHRLDPNIKWLWSPNRGTAISLQYYPGAAYVDYVGLSLNRTIVNNAYPTFPQFYGSNQAVIESLGKPVMISETTADEALGNKAAWVSGMFDYLKTDPNIVGFIWFNGLPNSGYAFNSSPAVLQAFRAGLASLNTGGR